MQVNCWRAPGDAALVQQLKGAFDRGQSGGVLRPEETVGNVTALVLRFLNEIPEGSCAVTMRPAAAEACRFRSVKSAAETEDEAVHEFSGATEGCAE